MQIYSASNWEDTDTYIYKKKAKCSTKKRTSKELRKKKQEKRNSSIRSVAEEFVQAMKNEPSVLEKRMQEFLDNYGIQYEFQKPLYIKRRDGTIRKFYIADFYIPARNLIIETDGKFHDDQVKQDEKRTKEIQKYFSNMKVIRWRWHDFDSSQKVKDLLKMIKPASCAA